MSMRPKWWIPVGLFATLLTVGSATAALVQTGPFGDRSGSTAVGVQIPGERTTPGHPDGNASDQEKSDAKQQALQIPSVESWLRASQDWELLWVERYAMSDPKGNECLEDNCLSLVFYAWDRSLTLAVVLDPASGEAVGSSPTEVRAPMLTGVLKERAIELASSDPDARRAVGANFFVSNVADFDGYGICGEHLCALVGLVSRDKPLTDRSNGVSVQVDLVRETVVFVSDHTGVLKDNR